MKSKKLLSDFTRYCEEHPEERFWQALRNWVGWEVVKVVNYDADGDVDESQDTFYWESNK